MSIPTAVASSTLTPGIYITVDLLAGTASPGTGTLRVALMASKSAAGDLTIDTEVRSIGGEADASTGFGPGTVGHLAAKQIYTLFGEAQVDIIAPTAGATTATLNVTAAGVPTGTQVVDIDLAGRTGEIAWLSGETADQIKQKLIDWIVAKTNDCPATASTGGVGITTIDSKVDGNIGNDILVKAKLRYAQTGTETLTGAVVHTNLAGGTTDPDFTTALSYLVGTEYHYIVQCLSNADAGNVAASNNADKCYTHIYTYNTGLDAKLQQNIVGYTGAYATAQASTVHVNSFNNAEFSEMIECLNGLSLPGEFAGYECGARLAAISLDPAANRIGEIMEGLYGANDKNADKPTPAESEACLGNGVSLVTYNPMDQVMLSRAVTTHSKDSGGGADRRLLDTQNVDAAYIVARDLRTNLPIEFAGAKIQADSQPGDEPPPAGVVEERDIKTYIISRLRFWVTEGVVHRASLNAYIAAGKLIVQVDATDPTQVNMVVPYEIMQPLAKMGLVAQRVPS
ncbi:MAG: hypothetical protein U9Q07_04220 [Planctomycetota bacterium]|nr:hypothetical protein [Planctomycetota bacterium]